MPEIIFNGPAGRLEGRFTPGKKADSPIALILHPHPVYGGTMNNKVVHQLYYTFLKRGCATLRFNFRGVGRSQGAFDNGQGELADAASALDWLQTIAPNSSQCWIAGFSFGAWIAMQLLMRRPEITGFIAVAPPANTYDFTFLAPCPSSGLIVHGTGDNVVPPHDVAKLAERLSNQRGITVTHKLIQGANHFFVDKLEELGESVDSYVGRATAQTAAA
jgi:alpha/beta superfamily hydrolase